MAELLVVGSVALDSVETPFGKVQEVLGGSATFFSYAASFLTQVRLVATVGQDFPSEHVKLLRDRGEADEQDERCTHLSPAEAGTHLKDDHA